MNTKLVVLRVSFESADLEHNWLYRQGIEKSGVCVNILLLQFSKAIRLKLFLSHFIYLINFILNWTSHLSVRHRLLCPS